MPSDRLGILNLRGFEPGQHEPLSRSSDDRRYRLLSDYAALSTGFGNLTISLVYGCWFVGVNRNLSVSMKITLPESKPRCQRPLGSAAPAGRRAAPRLGVVPLRVAGAGKSEPVGSVRCD